MEREVAYITSLIGDPVRTTILWTLLDNRAYTATELAISADTSAQNISMHLNKLIKADLLTVEKQGRHKYYKFSKPEIAEAIEALGTLVPREKHKRIISNKENSSIKYCRTCYDHLAGEVGVLLVESLLRQKVIEQNSTAYTVTQYGHHFFFEFGIDIEDLKRQRRAFARRCLDWSERKHHLAGSLGAALLGKMLSLDYVRRTENSRAIVVTSKGKLHLYDKFKVSV